MPGTLGLPLVGELEWLVRMASLPEDPTRVFFSLVVVTDRGVVRLNVLFVDTGAIGGCTVVQGTTFVLRAL